MQHAVAHPTHAANEHGTGDGAAPVEVEVALRVLDGVPKLLPDVEAVAVALPVPLTLEVTLAATEPVGAAVRLADVDAVIVLDNVLACVPVAVAVAVAVPPFVDDTGGVCDGEDVTDGTAAVRDGDEARVRDDEAVRVRDDDTVRVLDVDGVSVLDKVGVLVRVAVCVSDMEGVFERVSTVRVDVIVGDVVADPVLVSSAGDGAKTYVEH